MLESDFQASLIKEFKRRYIGCVVLKNDSSYLQGVPDLLILHKAQWAMLEVKKSEKAPYQPNQEYWLAYMSKLSYSSTIFPENARTVFLELDTFFGI